MITNRIKETEQTIISSYFICKNNLIDIELTVIKTPEWGQSQPEQILSLLEYCMINFCLELDSNNFPSGKIKIDHSHNYYYYKYWWKRKKIRHVPSCNYLGLPYKPEKIKNRRIYLHTKDLLWHQCSYQYLHEFTHYLTKTLSQNWFIETICELSSYYFLRKMSNTWESALPVAGWHHYQNTLYQYAQDGLDSIPEIDSSLAYWFKKNKEVLLNDRYARKLNNVVMKYYLPYFENNPGIWNIICYMPFYRINCFNDFMHAWYKNCPCEYKDYIHKFISDLCI